MKNNNYDHINEYLNARINDSHPTEIRQLIGDFTILWNQYERAIYDKGHHIYEIKSKIALHKLEKIPNITVIYNRFKKYVSYRGYEYTAESLIDMFNIRIIKNKFDKRTKTVKKLGDIDQRDVETMIRGSTPFEKLYCLLVIVAKVRNNMFHGTKGAWELSKQKDLFRLCNELLMSVLETTNTQDI